MWLRAGDEMGGERRGGEGRQFQEQGGDTRGSSEQFSSSTPPRLIPLFLVQLLQSLNKLGCFSPPQRFEATLWFVVWVVQPQ